MSALCICRNRVAQLYRSNVTHRHVRRSFARIGSKYAAEPTKHDASRPSGMQSNHINQPAQPTPTSNVTKAKPDLKSSTSAKPITSAQPVTPSQSTDTPSKLHQHYLKHALKPEPTVKPSTKPSQSAPRIDYTRSGKPAPAPSDPDDVNLDPATNARVILDMLKDHERAMPIRRAERLILSILSLASANKIRQLTSDQCLILLRSLTRRELTCVKDLPHYRKLAAETSPASSAYHPEYIDSRIMSRLSDEGRIKLRRGFQLLSLAIEADMATQSLIDEQPPCTLNRSVMLKSVRILNLAQHRYMASRIQRSLDLYLPEVGPKRPSSNPLLIQKRFDKLLASPSELSEPSSSDIAQFAQQLEQLTLTSTPLADRLHVLLLSSARLYEVNDKEIESLSSVLPLVSAKLEISRESEVDRFIRWRVMLLTARILAFMKQYSIPFNPLIVDELMHIYASCAAVSKSFATIDSMKKSEFGSSIKPDMKSYQWLLRACSMAQRWENPHLSAERALKLMQDDGFQPDLISINDAIRACDRAEHHEHIEPLLEMIKSQGLEPNETTHHYVTQAYIGAGMDDAVIEKLLPQAQDREDFFNELAKGNDVEFDETESVSEADNNHESDEEEHEDFRL